MNDLQIKCFLEAAKCHSFSDAAGKVFMTPPTFGRYISSLERELGYPLFIRGWKSLRLTAAGEIMYEGFQEIFEKMDTLKTSIDQLNNGQTGQLTLGILEGQMVDHDLRDALKRFRDAYPNLLVKLERYSFREMETNLADGKLDIGITLTIEAEQNDDFTYKQFCTLPNSIVMPIDHPLAGKADLTLSDFSNDKFLEVVAEESRMVSQLLHHCCISAGFKPEVIVYPDFDAQLFALETGLGVAAFNQYHVACNNPSLVARVIPGLPTAEFCAAWHIANPNPAVKLFAEHLSSVS
jgi:DNA-binding transcriptional LysR family regulator